MAYRLCKLRIKQRFNGESVYDHIPDSIGLSNIPADIVSSSRHETLFSIKSNSGFSISHYQEKNGKGARFGFSHSFNERDIANSEYRLRYTEGDNQLDATYAHLDHERIEQAWSDGILGRVINNISSETNNFTSLLVNPPTIATELKEQLFGRSILESEISEDDVMEEEHSEEEIIESANKKEYILFADNGLSSFDVPVTSYPEGKSMTDFYIALAHKESTNNPKAKNEFGYIGLYQTGEGALIDGGYYKKEGKLNNNWKGKWTGKNGINNLEDFVNNPDAQTLAIKDYHKIVWNRFLKSVHLYQGKEIQGVLVTKSGMLAASHLRGAEKLIILLKSDGKVDAKDANGVSCLQYLKLFAGYELNF